MKFKCTACGWQGDETELVTKYFPNPQEPGDVIPEAVCPVCGNQSIEEDNDQAFNTKG